MYLKKVKHYFSSDKISVLYLYLEKQIPSLSVSENQISKHKYTLFSVFQISVLEYSMCVE